MKKLVLGALALAALLPSLAYAQDRAATLAFAFDLDGEAADADQIVTAANGDLLDSKSFTITASPDVCRLVDMTVTDANSSITAGTITVVGVDCLGFAKTCSLDWSVVANRGSGIKSFTCTDGSPAYYATVTTVDTSDLTGEGGAGVDLATIGYTSNSVNGWGMYGRLSTGPNGEHFVDPFGTFAVPLPITTSGSASTTVTSVSSNGAFNLVAAGDLLQIRLGGVLYERKVTARASANSITVNAAINIPAAGTTFLYKKFYYSTNPYDIMAVPVVSYSTALFDWSVDANASTGGVIDLLECSDGLSPDWPTAGWVSIATDTVATGTAQVPTSESIDLTLLPYVYCRLGFRFGTGDDGDGAAEDLNARVILRK